MSEADSVSNVDKQVTWPVIAVAAVVAVLTVVVLTVAAVAIITAEAGHEALVATAAGVVPALMEVEVEGTAVEMEAEAIVEVTDLTGGEARSTMITAGHLTMKDAINYWGATASGALRKLHHQTRRLFLV